MKPLLFAVCVVFAFGGVSAQQSLLGSHRPDTRKCRYGRGGRLMRSLFPGRRLRGRSPGWSLASHGFMWATCRSLR